MKFIFLIILFLEACLGKWIRPNLFLIEEKYEILKRDPKYLVAMTGEKPEVFTDKEIDEYDKKKDSLKKENPQSNLFYIYALKSGEILEPEKAWEASAREKGPNNIEFYNLLRTMYLLEDWDGARNFIREIFSIHPPEKKLIERMIGFLKGMERYEESILVLDIVSEFDSFEISAREEIAAYYLSIGDIPGAKRQYERILSTFSFHRTALLGMLKASVYEENWEDGLEYLKVLRGLGNLPSEAYLFALQVFYEKGEYEQALDIVKKSPVEIKDDPEFRRIWKGLVFSSSKDPDLRIFNGRKVENQDFSGEEEKSIYRMLLRGN